MIRVATLSERGGDHPHNEDFVLCKSHIADGSIRICFLADGQGGRPDGEKASRIACEAGIQVAQSIFPSDLFCSESWEAIFEASDREVADRCEGFTTLIGFAVGEGRLFGASSGDSKLYCRMSNGDLSEPTNRQQKNPPIGSSGCVPICFEERLNSGSRLLATSDGVWKFAGFDAIRNSFVLETGGLQTDELLRTVRSRFNQNLPDDFSAIAVDIV